MLKVSPAPTMLPPGQRCTSVPLQTEGGSCPYHLENRVAHWLAVTCLGVREKDGCVASVRISRAIKIAFHLAAYPAKSKREKRYGKDGEANNHCNSPAQVLPDGMRIIG